MLELQKQIKKINKLLINHFGIPKKNEKPPDPLEMIIATILSQNTNDKNSYQAYKNLKNKFKSYEELADAKRASIEKEIKIAGLGKQKSEAIKNLLTDLKEKRKNLSLDFGALLTQVSGTISGALWFQRSRLLVKRDGEKMERWRGGVTREEM